MSFAVITETCNFFSTQACKDSPSLQQRKLELWNWKCSHKIAHNRNICISLQLKVRCSFGKIFLLYSFFQGTSPLNNATYWEAEEDPEWDNCVMVVATQKSRQRLGGSDDSLARSLHKDVDYPAINVSRRSPDHQSDTPLAPDSRYPTSNGGPVSGHRKRQNTLLDTGWHTCFKNNNYVFVRNGSGTRPDRQVRSYTYLSQMEKNEL